MDCAMDTQQCLEILQLECATSPEELKKAYEDLVQIWQPDRFEHDPSLKKIAEEKIRKIKLAYHHCLAYFDPDQNQCLKPSTSTFWDNLSIPGKNETFGAHHRNQSSISPTSIDDTRRQQSSEFADFRITKKSQRSHVRRYVWRGIICILLMVSGLSIFFFFEKDNLASKFKIQPSEAIKKMANKLEKNEPIQKNIPPVQQEMKDQIRVLKPVRTQEYYEIYLTDGSSFMTRSCWEEGNMIKFKIYKGSMGVEKHKVTKIVKRRYPKRK